VSVQRLIGVYDADGTVRGELTYFIGARLGRAHCALCDLTHGRVRERNDWKECRAALPVPFDLYHRDDQPATARAAGGDEPPCVLADTGSRLVLVLDGAALAACDGDLGRFTAALDASLAHRGLSLASG
jgi:hypothetical protein